MLARPARAQSSAQAWSFTLTGGAFVRGNGHALSRWLGRNGYGVSREPCGFDLLLNRTCDPTQLYPQANTSRFAWAMSVRRELPAHLAVEVFVANEQSGTVTGRCDATAVPRDPRCTDPFLAINFSGASFASLVATSLGNWHVGAGPAVLFANWELKPAHLAGVWLDASYGIGSPPPYLPAPDSGYCP